MKKGQKRPIIRMPQKYNSHSFAQVMDSICIHHPTPKLSPGGKQGGFNPKLNKKASQTNAAEQNSYSFTQMIDLYIHHPTSKFQLEITCGGKQGDLNQKCQKKASEKNAAQQIL